MIEPPDQYGERAIRVAKDNLFGLAVKQASERKDFGTPGKKFFVRSRCGRFGILCVFRSFRTEELAKKI